MDIHNLSTVIAEPLWWTPLLEGAELLINVMNIYTPIKNTHTLVDLAIINSREVLPNRISHQSMPMNDFQ